MKQLKVIGALVVAVQVAACGGTGAGGEEYGEAEQTLVYPFWSRPILAPYDDMASSTGIRVCRNGAADYIPGQLTTSGCLYALGNQAKVASATYEYLGTLGTYSWDRATIFQNRTWVANPDIPGKMVVSAGIGVCEGRPQASVSWIPGRFNGSACVVNVNGTVTSILVGTTSENVRVLIAH
jgi:hypothetical protein